MRKPWLRDPLTQVFARAQDAFTRFRKPLFAKPLLGNPNIPNLDNTKHNTNYIINNNTTETAHDTTHTTTTTTTDNNTNNNYIQMIMMTIYDNKMQY